MTDVDIVLYPQHFGSDPVDIQIESRLIEKSGLECCTTFG